MSTGGGGGGGVVKHLKTQTSAETIAKLKSTFAVHGMPDLVVSDNGPQLSSQ